MFPFRAAKAADDQIKKFLVDQVKAVSCFVYLLVEKCRFALEEERSILQEAKPDT